MHVIIIMNYLTNKQKHVKNLTFFISSDTNTSTVVCGKVKQIYITLFLTDDKTKQKNEPSRKQHYSPARTPRSH